VWARPDGEEVAFPLGGAILHVGRDETSDIRVDEPLVSRNHARLERRGTAWVLLDLGSTNLTRVNGDPIRERELRHGDVVQFARARCRFEDAPADPVAGGV
jgi:pSer/pThr/pTyr-binding forkhead associated (FHA) protein